MVITVSPLHLIHGLVGNWRELDSMTINGVRNNYEIIIHKLKGLKVKSLPNLRQPPFQRLFDIALANNTK